MQFLDILALLSLALILAKLMGGLFLRLGMPEILGYLIGGVMLGNSGWLWGVPFEALQSSPVIQAFAALGVITLVFVAGLESSFRSLFQAGKYLVPAVLVWLVLASVMVFVLGSQFPTNTLSFKMLLVASLGAISLGIPSHVMRKTGFRRGLAGETILALSFVGNLIGLLLVSVSSSLVAHGTLVAAQNIVIIVGEIATFALLIALSRTVLVPRMVRGFSLFQVPGTLTVLTVSLAVLSSWVTGAVGLVGIVGAFALGLVLDEVQFQKIKESGTAPLETFITPLMDYLVPIFFLSIGAQVKLAAFEDPQVIRIFLIFLAITLVGKLACGFIIPNSVAGGTRERFFIGVGILPQGEIGLLFATLGFQAGVLRGPEYSAILGVVLLTSVVSPLILLWRGALVKMVPAIRVHPAPPPSHGGVLKWLKAQPLWVRLAFVLGPCMFVASAFGGFVLRVQKYAQAAQLGQAQTALRVIATEAVVIPTGTPERILEGLKFFKDRGSPFVLITGTENSTFNLDVEIKKVWGEAADVAEIKKRIVQELNSHTTYQNAQFSAPLLRDRAVKRIILVNEDVYLPRAMTIFENEMPDITVLPYSVPSGFSKISLSLNDNTINGVTYLWWEFCKNIIWDVYGALKPLIRKSS